MTDIKVCLSCQPGLRKAVGARLSHGYCRFHALEEYEKAGLLTEQEAVELRLRRACDELASIRPNVWARCCCGSCR